MSEPKVYNGYTYTQQADGSWKRGEPVAPQMPADPTFQYEGPKAAAEVTGANLDNQGQGITNTVNAGTARTTIQTNQAPEGTMWRDPNNPSAGVVRIPGYEEKRVTPELRAAALQGFKDAESIAATVEMLRQQYYAGPGQTKGIYGLGDYFPTDANASFNDTGQRARGYVKGALGFTGGEGNTAMEADATYGPYLPTAGDKDGQIANKIAALEALGMQAREKAIATLGGIPDQYGNIQPIPEGERPNAMTYLRTDGGAGNQTEAAGFNATQKAVPYPEAGQSLHDQLVGRLIAEGDGRLDPQAYAQERMALDRQQGVEPGDPASYAAWAESINTYLGEGGKTIPTGIEPTMQDMSYGETVRNRAASSPEGALFAGYLNSGGLGIPEMLTGANMDMIRAEQPVASITGEIGGALTGTSLVGRLGREGLERFGREGSGMFGRELSDEAMDRFRRNIYTDVAYGSAYGGTTEGKPVTGALLGGAGSVGGQALGKTAETAIGGIKVAPAVERMRAAGTPITIPQALGGMAKAAEEKATSFPILGDIIGKRHMEGRQAFNRGAFDIGAETVPGNVTETGMAGIQQLDSLKSQAYRNALDPITLDVAGSPTVREGLMSAQLGASTIPQVGDDAANAIGYRAGAVDIDGTMTGRDFQEAYRGLARDGRGAAPGSYGHEFGQSMREAQDVLARGLEEQNPGAFAGFTNANQANRRLNVLADATHAAKNQEDQLFTPKQLQTADANSATRLTGRINASSGNRPFAQYASDGVEVLSNNTPNSFTADRAAQMGLGVAGLGALGGGAAEYSTQGNLDTTTTGLGGTAAALTLLAALGSKRGQQYLGNILIDRPDAAKQFVQNLNARKGLFGRMIPQGAVGHAAVAPALTYQ